MIDTDKALQELSTCGDRKKLYNFAEAVFDIASMIHAILGVHRPRPGSRFENSRDQADAAIEWALEFEKTYALNDWINDDYFETIDAFTVEKMREHVVGAI